ncbi:hypothetical protein E3O25_01920 [Cryobacterium sp. TMT1-3]|uniref:Uncharacterized protein n=1 Tax=Cryobacterium luteum TaxID=1424661 RepID=A0A1H8CUS5_9MICO|nr:MULTISPECIES: hypothetical protein [Cryobacterium]TFB91789.1 hypothetical protein E3O10_05280 [Cryobacterium luteum]TFC31238.1 hypothetical protein E3O25_01920 [Cryobacterium sp. TMT1-3]SEM98632.1 hypothetical protein SAMN05216281_10313 [Cryobacterium luteum]
MGFLDFLLGRKEQSPTGPAANRTGSAPARSEDEVAVERYQYLLRTAPPETIEQVHTEAFSKLTDEQRDILFRQLTENVPPSERPADAAPATLAQAATRAELRQPGTLTRSFGNQNGMGFGGMMGSSLLGTVAGFVIGSALVSAFMPMDGGGTDAGNEANTETNADAGSDAGGDSGGDVAGDFGGDFGGGDFGF